MKKCLNAGEITASVTAVANIMAKKLSAEELGLLSNVFLMLGDSLAVIASVKTFNETVTQEQKASEREEPSTE